MQLKPNNEKGNHTFSSDARLDKTGERLAPVSLSDGSNDAD